MNTELLRKVRQTREDGRQLRSRARILRETVREMRRLRAEHLQCFTSSYLIQRAWFSGARQN
jgi:hypothetical protein